MKRISISTKVILVVFIGYTLISTYFIVWSYLIYLNQAENTTLMRLQGIANSLALQINGDEHEKLMLKYPKKDAIQSVSQDSFYHHIHQILAKNFEANMLKTPIYTMIFDSLKNQFEFAVTSEKHPYFRHLYKSFPQIIKEKFETGGTIPTYQDEFGAWLSAFTPIRNHQNKVVAVIQVDQRFDHFTQNAYKMAYRNILIAAVVFVPILLILLALLRIVLLREEKFTKALEDALKTNADISQQLEESLERLTSLDELRKEMIANISHDLRTPMASIVGYIETLHLKQDTILPEERRKYLQIITKETERLGKLVNDLFELSKLEANQVMIEIEPFPIAELAHDIIQKYQLLLQEKDIHIQADISAQTPYVMGDIKLIDRVLQNLLDNACKYNFEKGTVKVSISTLTNTVEVKVSNTGAGISAEMLKNIFDRYYKGSKNNDSTGLGLAIVKKILDLHKTNIYVASEPEKMTSFWFTLPIYVRESV